jgi:hypothetical protein
LVRLGTCTADTYHGDWICHSCHFATMEARFAQQANARRALVPNISRKLEIALPNIVYCTHVADLLMSSLPIASLTFSITISSNRALEHWCSGKSGLGSSLLSAVRIALLFRTKNSHSTVEQYIGGAYSPPYQSLY